MDHGIVVNIEAQGAAQLEYRLQAIRASAPWNPIRVISDGVNDPAYHEVCAKYRAVYVLGDYLRRIECGGAWWERFLREGLATGSDVFVRGDPDAYPWDVWTQAMANRILASALIRSDELKELYEFCPNKDLIHLWYPLGHLDVRTMIDHIQEKLGGEFGSSDMGGPPYCRKVGAAYPRGVDPDTLIRIITTCMGRLDHLSQTLPRWLAEPGVEVLVVDWSCPHGAASWVREWQDSRAQVVRVDNQTHFNLAAARNAGARHASQWLPDWHAEHSPEIWAFVDADVLVEPGWAAAVRSTFREGHYHVADPLTSHMGGTVVLRPSSYFAAGGYDETLQGWGCDDTLFYLQCRHAGIRAGTYPGDFARAIKHNDKKRTLHYEIKDKYKSNKIFDHYYRIKSEGMLATGVLPSVDECKLILEEARSRDWTPGTRPGCMQKVLSPIH